MASNKNRKKIFNPLSNDTNNSSTMINMLTKTDTSEENATKTSLPTILANLTTGMDVFPIDRSKLVAAPNEWNFYSPLSENKMTELIQSIETRGLLHPIVVWQQSEDAYMILSGHNRNSAYEYLYSFYKDTDFEKANRYKTIHAHIFKKEQLEEEDAKQIIIDTNFVQRELSPIEKQKSIFNKYTYLGRKQRTVNGIQGEKNRDLIAKDFNISGRQVSKYIKLNYLIPEFQQMIDNKDININSGVILADFSIEMQQWIYTTFKDKLKNKTIEKIKSTLSQDEIENIFNPTKIKIESDSFFETKSLSLPMHLREQYIKIMYKFLKDNAIVEESKNTKEIIEQIIKTN